MGKFGKWKNIAVECAKIAAEYGMNAALLPFRLCRVQKNKVILTSYVVGNAYEYSCNLKYMYEYLKKQDGGQLQFVWAFREPEKYDFLEEEGAVLVRHGSFRFFYELMTSKFVLTTAAYAARVSFRRKQQVIHLWHGGGAYKRMDDGEGINKWFNERKNHQVGRHVTLFVSSSKAFENAVIRGSFAYKGEVLSCGMPRNDFLYRRQTKEYRQKIHEKYHIPMEEKIVLYAPTYRLLHGYDHLNLEEVIEKLEAVTGDHFTGFVRWHHWEKAGKAGSSQAKLLDVTDYPDMQELLAAADILITDYSSSIWDYSLLGRPCFLYTPDLDDYQKDKGFYLPIEQWQYPYAKTKEQLFMQLEQLLQTDWEACAKRHQRELESAETGCAAKRVAEYMLRQ